MNKWCHVLSRASCFREFFCYVLCTLCCCVFAALSFSPVVLSPSYCLLWAVYGLFSECDEFLLGVFFSVVKWDLLRLPQELRHWRTLRSRDMWAGVCAGLLGKGPITLGLRHAWLRTILSDCRGVQLQLALSCFCVYAGTGRGMVPTSSLVHEEVSSWMFPLREALWKVWIIFHCVSQTFFRLMFSHCLPWDFFYCLLSRSRVVPSRLYPRQSFWPLKLQDLSSAGCKNSWNSALSASQASGLGKCSPCAFSYMFLSLPLFSMTMASFSLKHPWYVSSLNCILINKEEVII